MTCFGQSSSTRQEDREGRNGSAGSLAFVSSQIPEGAPLLMSSPYQARHVRYSADDQHIESVKSGPSTGIRTCKATAESLGIRSRLRDASIPNCQDSSGSKSQASPVGELQMKCDCIMDADGRCSRGVTSDGCPRPRLPEHRADYLDSRRSFGKKERPGAWR